MIIGAHVMLHSRDEAADRAFLSEVLKFGSVDAGDGFMIYGIPPAEMAVHGSERNDLHQLYLMCEDMEDFVDRMFAPFSDNREWRCSKCEYGIGEDGDIDERVKWCEDCGDELRINMADDMELLEEIPVVSDITREWG